MKSSRDRQQVQNRHQSQSLHLVGTSRVDRDYRSGDISVDHVLNEPTAILRIVVETVVSGVPERYRTVMRCELEQLMPKIFPEMLQLLEMGGGLSPRNRRLIAASGGRLCRENIPISVIIRSAMTVPPKFRQFMSTHGAIIDGTTCLRLLARFSVVVGGSIDAFTSGYVRGTHAVASAVGSAPDPVVSESTGMPWAEQCESLPHELSEREREVLALVAEGCTNLQIAGRLNLSSRTVANRLYRLYPRLGVQSRAGATKWWLSARPLLN